VAAVPLVAGWLLHVTAPPDQSPVTRSASSVWPAAAALAFSRSLASVTTQPGARLGFANACCCVRLAMHSLRGQP
jgi:hypothetical protein